MAQDLHAPPQTYRPSGHRRSTAEQEGWMAFAATLFFAGAAINAMYGVLALVNDDHFAADELLFGDLSAWGVGYLVLAGVQALVAVMLLRGNRLGVWLGILLALTHAMIALLTIGAYPVWSLCAIAIDGMVIYALTVHGPSRER